MSVLRTWMSFFPPALTFSSKPTFAPFFPLVLFGLFSSAMISPKVKIESMKYESLTQCSLHHCQKRSGIVELARLSLRPLIQTRSIHDDLPIRRQFYVGTVHWARRRSLEI